MHPRGDPTNRWRLRYQSEWRSTVVPGPESTIIPSEGAPSVKTLSLNYARHSHLIIVPLRVVYARNLVPC